MSETGEGQKTLLTNGVGSAAVAHQTNGILDNTKITMPGTLLNFSSPQLEKGLTSDAERNSKTRFENMGVNANEKVRLDLNCPKFDKRLDSGNTHVESIRLEPNTHQHVVGSFEKRLDGHLNHVDKGRMEGIHVDKNILHDKPRSMDGVTSEKGRVDGMSVDILDNPVSMSGNLDTRTLDIVSNFDKCSKDAQIDMKTCTENSVLAPISLDKRKDSHSEKGRMDRDSSLGHIPISSPNMSNTGAVQSHLYSSAMPNNPHHQQAPHQAGIALPHKPLHSSHPYQNSIRADMHNPGLPSQNGTFPPKKSMVLHGPNAPSIKSTVQTSPSVPSTTTSVSPVISHSSSISLPMSNPGVSNGLSTTLSLSNTGAGPNAMPGLLQHTTLHSISHMSSQRIPSDPMLTQRPGNSPQSGSSSFRSQNDSLQSGPRAPTPLSQHQNHSTSHVVSQALHGRLTPPEVSSASSTVVTSQHVSVSASSEAPPTPAVNSHTAMARHGGAGSGSPGVHPGYTGLPLPGAPFPGYPGLYSPFSSSMQHPQYLPPRVEPPVINGAA